MLQYSFYFMFCFFDQEACGILVPWSGVKPAPSALEGEVLTELPEICQICLLKTPF